jgi:hypothetical protein
MTPNSQLRSELKWLNSHLGVVRDLDVAIERLKGCQQKTGTGNIQPSTLERETRRQPSPPSPSASVSQVSASDRKYIRLGREWTQVHQERKTGRAGTCFAGRRIQHGQTDEIAGKAFDEIPQAREHGHQEATSAAPAEQEAVLFNRILRRSASGQKIFGAIGCAEALAQGAKSSWAVKRRCKGRSAGGHPAPRRRSMGDAISQSEAQKPTDSESGRGLSEAGRAEAVTHDRRATVCVRIVLDRACA